MYGSGLANFGKYKIASILEFASFYNGLRSFYLFVESLCCSAGRSMARDTLIYQQFIYYKVAITP